MGVISFVTDVPGQIGVSPRRVKVITTDGLATVTTAGYLDNVAKLNGTPLLPTDFIDMTYSYIAATNSGTNSTFIVSISNGVSTLTQWVNPGDVLLPVVSGDFAIFNGTSGQIKDGGFSPSNAAKTKVVMANGATVASHIMASTDTAGTSGNVAGVVINDGDIQAGRSGVQGSLVAYPATAASGKIIIVANANAGDFLVEIENNSHAQQTMYSIGDIGQATGGVVVATTALRMKSVAQAAVAGGAAAQTVTDAFCTTGSMVTASWNDTTNAVTIQKVAAGNGSFVVTSSADPGASHLNYIITK